MLLHYKKPAGKHMRRPIRKSPLKQLCLLLAALTICVGLPVSGLFARAAATPTNLGLAQQGMTAYKDGWIYVYGGKGEYYGETRGSDCAGLLTSYFTDIGAGGCSGGATTQTRTNALLSGSLGEGVPRIHGLALTIWDTDDAADGYAHIGIYIGNGESCENSDYGTNIVWASIYNRHWDSWHLFDAGLYYPKEGWYELDDKMVHYTDYEYDIDTEIDGYIIGSDGYAYLEDGSPAPVDYGMLSDSYVPAAEVRDWLLGQGWSGVDYPGAYDPSNPDNPVVPNVPGNPGAPGNPGDSESDHNGLVSHTSVNLRSEPDTGSDVVAVLHKNTKLWLESPIEGGEANSDGQTSTLWYPATTAGGTSGYISSLLVELVLDELTITSDGESVIMDAGDSADIYYTTDGSEPDELSTPYVSPVYQLGCTYKAVTYKAGVPGPVVTATVLSNGDIFTDFTYNDWYAHNVDRVVSMGVFGGTSAGSFTAKNKITRSQFVKALANLSGEDTSAYDFGEDIPAFSDVHKNAFYYNDLAWALNAGIVTPADKFRPNDEIPREQICTMLDRYANYIEADVSVPAGYPFDDDKSISSWAKDAVYRMRTLGVVNGVGANNFNPKGNCNRAEASTMIVNFYDYVIAPNDISGSNTPATKD